MSDYDPLDTQSTEQQSEDVRKRSQLDAANELGDFQWLIGQKRGRRIVWRLLTFCGVFRTSFTGNSTTFFNEGMRNVGLKLTSLLQHPECIDHYALMLKENQDVRRIDDR